MFLCEFKITLRDVTPAVWRRIAVPDTASMFTFHRVIQTAFGWRDYHDFSFYSEDRKLEVASGYDESFGPMDEEAELKFARRVTVAEFLAHPRVGKKALYAYDFGDGWKHDIKLIRRRRVKAEDFEFQIFDGSGRCPPEDVGGVDGYQRFKDVLAGKVEPERSWPDEADDRRTWYGLKKGEAYDPTYFCLYDAQTRLWKLQHYQMDPVRW